MADFANQTTSDQAQIASESLRTISFRPGEPGPISVSSVPTQVPLKSQSELGLLGRVELLKPGSTTPVASATAPIGSALLATSYTATAADLAPTGNWTCRIFNGSLIGTVFTTEITSVSDLPLKTASFDLPFLNTVLSEAAATAAVRVHLESSSDGSAQSVASWSVAVADLVSGTIETRFNIKDPSKTLVNVDGHTIDTTFHLLGLNSDPAYPVVALLSDPLSLVATLRFNTQGALLKANDFGVPDINIDSFQIRATVSFDGTIVPECDVTAILRFNSTDVSGDVKSNVESAINAELNKRGATPALVRQALESFFVRLMRLNGMITVRNLPKFGQAHIQGYSVFGNSLIVSYYQVPQDLTSTDR